MVECSSMPIPNILLDIFWIPWINLSIRLHLTRSLFISKHLLLYKYNKAFVGLGRCDNVQTERLIFEYANWQRLQIERTGQSSWSIQLVRPAGLFSWSVQMVNPAGPSSWSVQLVRPAGLSSWSIQLVWLADPFTHWILHILSYTMHLAHCLLHIPSYTMHLAHCFLHIAS